MRRRYVIGRFGPEFRADFSFSMSEGRINTTLRRRKTKSPRDHETLTIHHPQRGGTLRGLEGANASGGEYITLSLGHHRGWATPVRVATSSTTTEPIPPPPSLEIGGDVYNRASRHLTRRPSPADPATLPPRHRGAERGWTLKISTNKHGVVPRPEGKQRVNHHSTTPEVSSKLGEAPGDRRADPGRTRLMGPREEAGGGSRLGASDGSGGKHERRHEHASVAPHQGIGDVRKRTMMRGSTLRRPRRGGT